MRVVEFEKLLKWAMERWERVEYHQVARTMLDYEFESNRIKNGVRFDERAAVLHELDRFPTFDAVEVVWCKDCKHWQDQEEGVVESAVCVREKPMVMEIGPHGYCYYGERRTGDETD